MRQLNNGARMAPLSLIKFHLFVCLFLLAFMSSLAHASGAKLPTVSDGESEPNSTGTVSMTTSPPLQSSETTINEKYAHLDPENIVPKARLATALKYFDANKSKIKNKEFIGVIDFSQHSSKERFYVINMITGDVETFQVAHGKGSDPDFDGYATKFSNIPDSNMSSQGIYLTGSTYEGSHGYSLYLDGMSSTNSNARSRAIVIHPADYVVPGQKAGRSWGCPALDPRESQHVIDELKNGAVIYAE